MNQQTKKLFSLVQKQYDIFNEIYKREMIKKLKLKIAWM